MNESSGKKGAAVSQTPRQKRSKITKPRQVQNPPNPYSKTTLAFFGEPPKAKLEVFEDDTKSILSRNDSPDIPFRYSLNPYRGCMHGCAYCYARPTHQYLDFGAGSDFDRKIVVKHKAPELLRAHLSKKNWTFEPITLSGNTDCYMPLESTTRITRRCLEVLRDFENPFAIITKSAMVQRDVDVIAAASQKSEVLVNLSIPFARREDALKVEPWASPPEQRFAALKTLNDAGVPTALAIAPLILGLNDEQIPEILERARAAGTRVAWIILLRLPGVVRDIFCQRMTAAYPDRISKIMHAVDEERALQGARAHAFGHRMQGQGPRYLIAKQLFHHHAKRLGFDSTRMEESTGSFPSGGIRSSTATETQQKERARALKLESSLLKSRGRPQAQLSLFDD